jgi:hypothetical protein
MRLRWLLAGAIALALSGCALLRGPEAETPPTPAEVEAPPAPTEAEAQPAPSAVESVREPAIREPITELERLLNFFQRIKKLPGPELGRENDSARVAFTRSRSDFDRLRLAMVLSLPNTAFTDDAQRFAPPDSITDAVNGLDDPFAG